MFVLLLLILCGKVICSAKWLYVLRALYYVIPVLSEDRFYLFCLCFFPDPAHVYFSFFILFFLVYTVMVPLVPPLHQSPSSFARGIGRRWGHLVPSFWVSFPF